MDIMKESIQHGRTSVYEHSISVAYTCLKLVDEYNLKVDRRSLVRGALLHDYFLYDWHDHDKGHSLHGFTHPATALENANRDFDLNDIEKDMIKKHMFPLTPKPPKYTEGYILCVADKICSSKETLNRKQ
ncbi:MAG: HD domain-containing protein [Holdemanella sp.]|nr:HD domain-containing protein [Holdemanella sp.]